jgi:hypothetical protein
MQSVWTLQMAHINTTRQKQLRQGSLILTKRLYEDRILDILSKILNKNMMTMQQDQWLCNKIND